MKLYDSLRAPNPRRVRWFLAEKGVEDQLEIINLDILKQEHRDPGFLAKAGLANIPALEIDDETTITESVAICRYLESLFPEPNMFGRDAKETAVIEMWTRRAEMMLATPLMLAVRHSHPALAALEKQIPEIAESNKAGATRALKVFERRLGESAFIGGDRVTIADILAACSIDFSRMARFAIPDEAPNVKRWYEAMQARPAAKAGTGA
ncbi:glutathione S-transferase family protein [Caulobacter mirabilis]|uniref:Glutathione S-transferase n=1 Tax=Caulobacter mirabilis TaxID=69666 RepID=A0A2D2AWJ7_9CAUL|nr:glutathione S-transferase [Caulobacter mirabilis]ATQ42341.1 glutathione S-transferase [Caulobacter mirabilis]